MVKSDGAFVKSNKDEALVWEGDGSDDDLSANSWDVKFSNCGRAEDLPSSDINFWVEESKLCWETELVLVGWVEVYLECFWVETSSHFLWKIDNSIQNQLNFPLNTKS